MIRRRTEQGWWWRFSRLVVATVFHLAFRMRFEGIEHIPRAGPALLAPNHLSVLDPIFVALAVSRRGRTLRFLAAAEFFDRPAVGWALRSFRQIPIRRGQADSEALERVAKVIAAGSIAGIFPEGRMGEEGALQRGRRGAARLALAAGAPLVPIGIWGSQRRWPRRGFRFGAPFRAPVAVVFGQPIPALGDARSRRDVQALTDLLMARVEAQVERASALAGGAEAPPPSGPDR